VPSGTSEPSLDVPEGARGGEVQAAFRGRRNDPGAEEDTIRHQVLGRSPVDVYRESPAKKGKGKPSLINRLVQMLIPGYQRAALSYPEFARRATRNMTADQVQSVAEDALELLAGRPPKGAHGTMAAELATWMVQQEGHRNIAALPTHAMAIDLVARRQISVNDLVESQLIPQASPKERGRIPMQPKGSQKRARDLVDYLNRHEPSAPAGEASRVAPFGGRAGANRLAMREIEILKLWVASLEGFDVSDSEAAKSKEDMLILEIRRRIQKIYGVAPGDAGTITEAAFLASLKGNVIV
jgi:hypothetical protein